MDLPKDILAIVLLCLSNIEALELEELECSYVEEIWSINRKTFSNNIIKLISN